MKNSSLALITLVLGLAAAGCKSLDSELPNPNLPTSESAVPPSLILPRIEYDLYNSGDGGPFTQVQRWNQYVISNDAYYGGQNQYNWTTTASLYGVLRNVNQLDAQAVKQYGTKQNAYSALATFFRAYLFIWQAQRTGDIPASQAGQGLANLTPAYDTQKQVYARSLAMLDSANTLLGGSLTGAAQFSGDIYFTPPLAPQAQLAQWRKVVNSYKLRVLISLSKRAVDNADLQIPQQFAAIVNNPAQYPLLASNTDNWNFVFNSAYNTYPHTPNDANNQRQNIGASYLSLTTATQDPRTFVVATPAPAQLAAGKTVRDFSAYVGSNPALGLSDLTTNSNAGQYSFSNYLRYYSSVAGPEPYGILGYAEQNFNIAEAINRGWVSGSASDYYLRGINASLDFYGLADKQVLSIGNVSGKPFSTAANAKLDTVTVLRTNFLKNAGVGYKGNNADGLEQILNQKYVAFFQNSGYEAFYNWRRTGLPRTFISTGGGINAAGRIPRRWQYPVDEQTYNAANYQAALKRQFGGSDDLNQDTWLTK